MGGTPFGRTRETVRTEGRSPFAVGGLVARSAGLLIALLVGVLALVPAGASAEPLCTDTWTGASEGTWQTVTNWSTGKAPTSTDVACIGTGTTVNVTAGSNQAGVLLDKGTLVISEGSLEVVSSLEASSVASLILSGGALTGAATVSVSGSFSWSGESTMSGSGSTVLKPAVSGSIAITNGFHECRLTGRSLVNEGTLTFGGFTEALFSEGARLANAGTLKVNSGAGISIGIAEGSKVAPSIVNTGTFEKTEGEGTTRVVPVFENRGTATAKTGSLAFKGGGSSNSAGVWSASEGASLVFGAGSFSLTGGKWSGPVAINGANVTAEGVEGPTAKVTVDLGESVPQGTLSISKGSMTVSSLLLKESTLTGAGTLNVSSSLTWGAKGTMSGSGKTVLGSGGSGTVEGVSGAENPLLTERTLVNEGTLTFSGSTEMLMSEGARLENKGTLKVNAPVAFSINLAEGSKVAPLIVNTGTFEKTEGASITRVKPRFENLGSIVAQTGQIEILTPVATESSTVWGGSNPSAPGHPCPTCGEPITVATGNFSETQADLSVGGRGVGLSLTRYYNSQAAAAGNTGTFGPGWSSSFSDHLVVEKVSKKATLAQGNGSTVVFTEGEGGAFTAPAWTQDTLSGSKESGYTLTLANQVKYKFAGASGRLESVTDRNGNATALAYTEAGRLETITDPATRKITLKYNAEGLVESAKDPMGHIVKYAYEGGSLKSVTEPGEVSARWQFKYDGSHQLTEMIDGRAGKTINEYNASGQVTLQKDPAGRELSFEYEAFHTKITNKATGSVTDERFTSNDEPVSITHGFGTSSASTETFSYDAAGNVATVTDGNEHTTKYGYDAASNRTSMLDANKNETKWTYNATHDVETTTTPKGETTTIKRDIHGNPEVIERPAPESKTQTTKYKYATHGEVESVEDSLKRIWKYEYNPHGDRTSETDPEGDKRTWGYNEDSQETSTVSPRGHVKAGEEAKYTTKIERDEQGRRVKVTDPLGHTTKYAYDGNGNLETQTDPNTHKTTYTYDADNERTKVEAPNGTITETGYDGAGKVTSQIDGNKHETKYVRNPIEQVVEVIDPLSRKTTKEYDAAGNLKTLTDPAKRMTTYTYDAGSRLKEVSYSDGKTSAVKYEYDTDGNRKSMTDGTGTTSYTYDQLDRLTESKDGHGDKTGYEYDLANQQTKITYPNTKSITRAYDKAGRLEKITDWSANITKFAYDADSDLSTTTFPTGTTNVDKYAYNEADQMSEAKMTKGAETLASLAYVRDNAGQVKSTTSKGLPGEEKPAYEYDPNNRLKKGGTTAYEYDAADNPTKVGTGTYTYDKASELETGPSVKYAYNEMGQRTKTTPTTGSATTYGYDQAGNLTAVERPKEGEKAEIKDTYAYDGTGLRASQTISGTTTYLTWDMTKSLPLVLNDGTNSYIHGPGGLPVEQISSGGTVTYLHHDQQGSTRLLTGSTGAVTGSTTFDAYGNKTGSTGTTTTPLGYDGQYTSTDTGLIYLRARVYDPATAQFLTVDPLALITRAPYSYAEDNPLNLGDPSGLLSPTAGLERLGNDIGEGVSNVSGGFLNGLTGGLVEGSGDSCSAGYTVGQDASLLAVLLPEDLGPRLFQQLAKRSPKIAEYLLNQQAKQQLTQPGKVFIFKAAVEKLLHLFGG